MVTKTEKGLFCPKINIKTIGWVSENFISIVLSWWL